MTVYAVVVPIEYLYGTWTAEDGMGYIRTRIIPFRIVKRTPKRVFYVQDWIHHTTDRLGSVDRQQLEATGEVYNRARGGWRPDFHLTAEPPQLEEGHRIDLTALKAELRRLRVEMADLHPDRGGTNDAFIAARERYAAAKARFSRLVPDIEAAA